jgi:ribosomal protein S18 acetylase RimI-like enzyme
LTAARQWAQKRNLIALLAHAPGRNVPGIEFYQQRGFRISGFLEHFYPTREDALFLMCQL